LGCPSRFAGGQRTVVAPRMQRIPWFLASKLMYALSQQRSIRRWLSTKASQCRSSSCSRLTIPSRGQPTAAHVCVLRHHLWRRCLPLMSNVRRLTQRRSKAALNASSCAVNNVSGRLRSPSLWLEPNHTSNTTHALAEPDCQIGRSLMGSIGRSEARCNPRGRSVRAVRPASLAASARLWRLEYIECQCLLRSNSCTLRAGSKRGASMQPRTPVVQEHVYQARLRSTVLRYCLASKAKMPLVFQQPPNPSIEGTASGLRPPAAPHVKR
jgi:hypothetical protein